MLDFYRRFYSDNFLTEDSRDHQSVSSSEDGTRSADNSLLSHEHSARSYRISSPHPPVPQVASAAGVGDCVVTVMDPFAAGRNLCGSCPSSFRKKNTSELLQSIFARGLQELSAVVHPLLERAESAASSDMQPSGSVPDDEAFAIQKDLVDKVFPITYTLLCSRDSFASEGVNANTIGNMSTLFQTVCRNAPFADTSVGPYTALDSVYDEEQFRRALLDVEGVIFRANQLISKKVRTQALRNIITQRTVLLAPVGHGGLHH